MNGRLAGHALPALNSGIDVAGIEFNRVGAPSCPLGGEDRSAAAAKGIENDVIALRRIENGVGNQGDRLDRGWNSRALP